ncbi:low temperature requirement protein A [Microbacterium azadirachtae]|uniref:low temperature requirement protein A n=1 Tax=Microbacterium azadirachtae TaxID=582680 RepID=UPI00087EDE01|nr:low temperature requirement protein A [Microbacterium azadirachtae]UXW85230.1 low temperature requirement protein A [Microbacterium azadirachtae]SDM42616.1 Low temperature requirement protein LtrA [Microbacterium azadirachtae]SEG57548.1 Low temperature requirement protein LtrA [Microbacterium azadirachtae]SEG60511.1 Low temperature requirement protein LtrA [Microbacterium azadirachtae]
MSGPSAGRGARASTPPRFGLVRMRPRDVGERDRGVSNLELLFDLVFAAAVGISSGAMHELTAHGDLFGGVGAYLMVFFAIWWAWMNVTWFGTSFDTDDWLYRVLVIVQMGGAITIAAGSRSGILHGDFTWVVIGYVVLRLCSVAQWIRVASASPEYRATALRYAVSITLVQALWILRQPLVPAALQVPSLLAMVALELLVPVFAERARSTPWHPHHVSERFGAFTLILLGESVVGSTAAMLAAIEHHGALVFIGVAATALTVLAGMWWCYFALPRDELVGGLRATMGFGYGHFVVFAAAGAFSVGIENVLAALEEGHGVQSTALAGTLTVPVAAFFAATWALILRRTLPRWASVLFLVLVALVLLCTVTPWFWLLTAALVIGITAVVEVVRVRQRA